MINSFPFQAVLFDLDGTIIDPKQGIINSIMYAIKEYGLEENNPETLDSFIDVMRKIALEAKTNPELVKGAPYNTVVKRLDEAKAARNPLVKYTDLLE